MSEQIAKRDSNRIPTLIGVDNVSYTDTTTVAVNPSTHALIVETQSADTISTKTALTGSAAATYTVTTSSAQAVAVNTNRKSLIITNLSDNIVYLGVGQTAVLNSGIALNKYGTWSMDEYSYSTALINAITTTGGATLAIQEFT